MALIPIVANHRGMTLCSLGCLSLPLEIKGSMMRGDNHGKRLLIPPVSHQYRFIRSISDIPPALREHESRLNHFALQLRDAIRHSNKPSINVSKLYYLYSFDVMSDLAFGEPLNMLVSDENHFAIDFLHDGMDLLGPLSPVPWLVRISLGFPGFASNFKKLLSWSAKKLQHRMQVQPDLQSAWC